MPCRRRTLMTWTTSKERQSCSGQCMCGATPPPPPPGDIGSSEEESDSSGRQYSMEITSGRTYGHDNENGNSSDGEGAPHAAGSASGTERPSYEDPTTESENDPAMTETEIDSEDDPDPGDPDPDDPDPGEPLFPNSPNDLGVAVGLLAAWLARTNVSERDMADLLKIDKYLLPAPNNLPTSTKKLKRVMKKSIITKHRAHICPNGCCIYTGNNLKQRQCPVCATPRYKDGTKRPRKVFHYYSLIEYLTWLFSTRKFGSLATTHYTRADVEQDDLKFEIQDTEMWKGLYANDGFFQGESRGLSLSVSTDGLSPFRTNPKEARRPSSSSTRAARGGVRDPKLADSVGYSYTVKEKKLYAIEGKQTSAHRQWRGGHRHTHPPTMHAATNLQIQARVRQRAVYNLFKSAGQIVEEVVMGNFVVQAPNPDLPSMANMDQTDLEFDLQEEHIPGGFFRADIRYDWHRHIVFATDHQLKLLAREKTWYMDATFNVVGKPFYQLFGIHAFVREDDTEKQVPLAIVFMPNKDKKDYKKVLKKILRLLPGEPTVTTLVMNFEQGMWQAVRSVLPGKTRRGCAFHWTQAVYRKIQEFEWTPSHHYCRRTGQLSWEVHEESPTHQAVEEVTELWEVHESPTHQAAVRVARVTELWEVHEESPTHQAVEEVTELDGVDGEDGRRTGGRRAVQGGQGRIFLRNVHFVLYN
ncbi:hypothetical protein Bbelb_255730 [Branchiostoma belcheri]|nr:hypothetical protein Bbelb_255730 [Branchiostoma belcheri]